MTTSADVAVVGGGVVGCAVAWCLARAGVSVSLFERGSLGGEASGVSAGMLAPLAESSTPGPFAELALAGLRAFDEELEALCETSGLDPEYRRCGVLRLALEEADVRALQEAAAWQANARLELRWLEPRQVASLEPGLAPCRGALLSPREGHLHPGRLTLALAVAAARCGAVLHEHSPPVLPWVAHDRLQGLLVNGERRPFGTVVLAAGAWSGAWAAALGFNLPVRPVKGQMLLVRAVPPPVRHIVFAGHSYLVPRADGTMYVGATQEEAGFDRRVTLAAVRSLAAHAATVAPALAGAEVVGMGAGLRPGSDDGLPIIGRAPGMENLILATGHFRNGVLLSLITGRLVAALVQGQSPELPIDSFSPARFGALSPRLSPASGRGVAEGRGEDQRG
jgi:glycine oxidase